MLHCFLFSPMANMQGSDRHSSLLSTSSSWPQSTHTSFSGDCSLPQVVSIQVLLATSSLVSMSSTSLKLSVLSNWISHACYKPSIHRVPIVIMLVWKEVWAVDVKRVVVIVVMVHVSNCLRVVILFVVVMAVVRHQFKERLGILDQSQTNHLQHSNILITNRPPSSPHQQQCMCITHSDLSSLLPSTD